MRSVLPTLEPATLLDTWPTPAPRTWALVFGGRVMNSKQCSPMLSRPQSLEMLSHRTAERIHRMPRSILRYVLMLRRSTRYTNIIKQEDTSDTSIDTSPSSINSPPASTKPERPICWDYIRGRCTRPVCYYRHEQPPEPEGQSMSNAHHQADGIVCITQSHCLIPLTACTDVSSSANC